MKNLHYSSEITIFTYDAVYIKLFTKADRLNCKHWYNPFLICQWCGLDAGVSGLTREALEREKTQGPFSFESPIT